MSRGLLLTMTEPPPTMEEETHGRLEAQRGWEVQLYEAYGP